MKIRNLIFFLSLLIVLFAACSKSGVNGDIRPTYVQMMNTCYGKTFNLHIGDKDLLTDVAYDSISPFAIGTPGFYSLQVIKSTTKTNVLTGNINLQPNLYYSLYLVPDSTTGSDSVLYSLTGNARVAPLYDTAKIQLLNFAYNLPPVNFYMVQLEGANAGTTNDTLRTNSVIFQSRSYLDVNGNSALAQFYSVHTLRYKFVFQRSADRQDVYDTSFSLIKGAFYTVLLEGNYESTGADSMKVRFIQQ
ncbi:hypothetical protein A9P82_12610 [Arachidicoccus ginsenosidimutans]|uniref:DUF4397 domain-containing protein n=1 Tax=Arachidicoccus sp. BS20 TaxID=1850526 RepID=UPI0007F04F80|nr:DUF4397 domain-containing protein [Arachidicoccus sp. BS20]ANI90051.1 hypothetical protein A9P82_12610 [Arachidicoccus sp. BS20]